MEAEVRKWQYDMAFIVALGLLVFFAMAPYLGVEGTPDPLVVSGFGGLIGWVFAHQERERKAKKEQERNGARENHQS